MLVGNINLTGLRRKTGTTQGWSDAWFVGLRHKLQRVVGLVLMISKYLGPGQDGSKAALPAWARFMKAAHDTLDLP